MKPRCYLINARNQTVQEVPPNQPEIKGCNQYIRGSWDHIQPLFDINEFSLSTHDLISPLQAGLPGVRVGNEFILGNLYATTETGENLDAGMFEPFVVSKVNAEDAEIVCRTWQTLETVPIEAFVNYRAF